MPSKSPTTAGFRVMLSRPAIGFAEVAWHWTFGLAAVLLITYGFLQYLGSLPITVGDSLLLRSRSVSLIIQALLHIIRGSGPRLVEVSALIVLALTFAWIILATFGKAATLQALVNYFRPDEEEASVRLIQTLRSIASLNFLRVAVTLSALIGTVGIGIVIARLSLPHKPGAVVVSLIFLVSATLIWTIRTSLIRFLGLASIFAVATGEDALQAISAAVDFYRTRSRSLFIPGLWFGLGHLVALTLALSGIFSCLAFVALSPFVALAAALTVMLIYFAAVDYLRIGRLGSYIALIAAPDPPAEAAPLLFAAPLPSAPASPAASGVDPEELILSDLPTSPQFD